MPDLLHSAASVLGRLGPPHLAAAMAVLLLYAVQAEVRFGKSARASKPGEADRGSTRAISLAVIVPVLGLVFAIEAAKFPDTRALAFFGPSSPAAMPGMPALAWLGVAIGALGLPLRLWAVLTLRHRYTRTLLVHENHAIERNGPYRFVRHPGYLGSLLTMTGIALATGNAAVLVLSLVATFAAYAHRIRAEDAMLVAAFGDPYEAYRREVKALIPFLW
jgi:protein-S-isoprenylcysteine O-methyltransferase Ste14